MPFPIDCKVQLTNGHEQQAKRVGYMKRICKENETYFTHACFKGFLKLFCKLKIKGIGFI